MISCEGESSVNSSPDPEPNPEPKTVSLTGGVFDLYQGDTLYISDVSVKIDSLVSQTNVNGEFSFELQPGNYSIEITSSDHHTFSDSIVISDVENNIYDVQLESILFDMFPLNENNQWVYSYFYEDLLAPVDVITTGEISYSIIDISIFEEDSIYSFLEKINLQKIVYSSQFPNQNSENDTSQVSLEKQFSITLKSDGQLVSNGEETPISNAFSEFIGFDFDTKRLLSFNRFIPKSRAGEDSTLNITKNPLKGGNYTLKKDIGINSYNYSDRDGLWYDIELIEYNN